MWKPETCLLALLSLCTLQISASADVLQGEVKQEDELMRIARPEPGTAQVPSDSLRIERGIPVAPPRLKSGLVDQTAFSNPLLGGAEKANSALGAPSPGQFGSIPNNKFDLGAERGSKELVLAWEKWHKQLSGAIYTKWSDMVTVPGMATLRLTVSRDRHIQVQMLHSSGNRIFDQSLVDAISSLDGNPGLTFPSQSLRQFVVLESDYIAGHHVDPGFSWVKDDYEKVNEKY
jgi:TonB C terminal